MRLVAQPIPEISEHRFRDSIDWSRGQTSCWPYKGAKSVFGHGRMKIGGRLYSPHRVAYTLSNGPIPADRIVMHTCDNPACCNPAHLRLGTMRDNARDMAAKGRCPSQNGRVHITIPDDVVRAIREDTRPSREAAAIYGVSDGYIRQLRRGVQRRENANG